MIYNAIDIFSGCGGLSEGLNQSGFKVLLAFDVDIDSVETYRLNHPCTKILDEDIRTIKTRKVKKLLAGNPLHLLAGCPPCQGFSSIRRLNRKQSVRDKRNSLVLEFLRFVKDLRPLTIMMENVPGVVNYHLFKDLLRELDRLGYNPKVEIVDLECFGIPQRRRRLVLVGSRVGELEIALPTAEKKTVRDAIGSMESIEETADHVHRIVAKHSSGVMKRIKVTPKDGGSWKELPKRFQLECHKKPNIGFKDIYGRLRWDDISSTITGGCLNPSKGRFLHPEEDRCISAREAALLQTFPRDYKFPENITKTSISRLIGNALPPKFSYIQAMNIKKHLKTHRIAVN